MGTGLGLTALRALGAVLRHDKGDELDEVHIRELERVRDTIYAAAEAARLPLEHAARPEVRWAGTLPQARWTIRAALAGVATAAGPERDEELRQRLDTLAADLDRVRTGQSAVQREELERFLRTLASVVSGATGSQGEVLKSRALAV